MNVAIFGNLQVSMYVEKIFNEYYSGWIEEKLGDPPTVKACVDANFSGGAFLILILSRLLTRYNSLVSTGKG